MHKEKIVEKAQEIVNYYEESEFFDQIYKIISDWELESGEGNEQEGFVVFRKEVECGYTLQDIETEIDNEIINVTEYSEMFNIIVNQIVYYKQIDNMMIFDTTGGSEVIIEQIGFEDIDIDEEQYPQVKSNPRLYEEIEKQLSLLQESDPQDLFETPFDRLVQHQFVEVGLDK